MIISIVTAYYEIKSKYPKEYYFDWIANFLSLKVTYKSKVFFKFKFTFVCPSFSLWVCRAASYSVLSCFNSTHLIIFTLLLSFSNSPSLSFPLSLSFSLSPSLSFPLSLSFSLSISLSYPISLSFSIFPTLSLLLYLFHSFSIPQITNYFFLFLLFCYVLLLSTRFSFDLFRYS